MISEYKEKNRAELEDLKKRKLGLFSIIVHPISSKRLRKKIDRIPRDFLEVFDQEDYLSANDDIQTAIDEGKFENALEHFIIYGYDEVRKGLRRIGRRFPLLTENEYLQWNFDLEERMFRSWFDHFLSIGYKDFHKVSHSVPVSYPFEWTPELKECVKKYFDEKAYLEINKDVDKAVNEGEFSDAWEHFYLLGAEEVRRGERSLYSNMPKISEEQYVLDNEDIFDQKKYEDINTPFEHFLRYGVHEILSGERTIERKDIYVYSEPELTTAVKQNIEAFNYKPLISIVMPVYNVDVKWLKLAIDSLHKQWYKNWELCIADDASTKADTVAFLKDLDDLRIKTVFLDKNLHISGASNAALKLARGEYIALMDNDDELTPDALYEVVRTLNDTQADFIYSDEDKIEADAHFSDPHFKPDYAPHMFLSQNYISHLSVIKKSLVDKVGGWSPGVEGSQDYDLYLKVLELTDRISHIPRVLYHWRKTEGSTADVYEDKSYAWENGQKALVNAMQRRNVAADVSKGKCPGTYRVKYTLASKPLVSIVIPFKDKPELLDMCINSILDQSTYQNFEIIGMSNNSEEKETFEMMKALKLKDARIHFYAFNEPFNYSAINNYAVKTYAKGEHVILLNNDIEIITPAWIEELLAFSQQEDVGAVGAKLFYPNDTIQHAGVIIGIGGVAGHSHKYFDREAVGYFCRPNIIQDISAVTGACLMVKRALYLDLNGLNDKELQIAFNDVDFCLRLREKEYFNIYTPYAQAYHHESISRGSEDTVAKRTRFRKEVSYMMERHAALLKKGDPYYNQNLSLEFEDFRISGK